MNTSQISALLQVVLESSLGLMGVSVTLIALVPVLVEIAQSRSSDFFSGEDAKDELKRYLTRLSGSIVLFGLSSFLAIGAFFHPGPLLFWASLLFFVVGLAIIVVTSLAMAKLTIENL